ncbi:MAG: hypothetical protein KDI63_17405 [Gammaproteobacteria bacterium]|nr:hypothetical protein [Gammaproteobacteria bacterium]
MNIDWDSLNTFEEWAAVLHQLLGSASESIQSGDIAKRVATQNALHNFIMHSPNLFSAELDEIARKTIADIFETALDEALNNIASRSAELAMHIKTVRAVTQQAESAVKSIRLERATKVIESATQVIRDLADLKLAISTSTGDQALHAKIDKTVKSIQDLVPSVMAVKPEST